MSKKNPKVTVITAVYNGENYLGETIESVLNQYFTDFEYIIVDDQSTDNTVQLVEKYMKKDSRIKLIKNKENLGPFGSANAGIKAAKGKYIARIDHDDLAEPSRFEVQIKILDNDPKRGLTGSWALKIDENGNEFSKMSYPPTKIHQMTPTLFFANPIIHSTIMFRADTAKKVGGYNQNYRSTQDYDFYFRIVEAGYKLHNHGKFLVKYRDHPENITNTQTQKQKNLIYTILIYWYKKLLDVEINKEDINLVVWPPNNPTKEQSKKITKVMDEFLAAYKKKWPQEVLEIQEVAHRRTRLTSNQPLSFGFRLRRKLAKVSRDLFTR